MPSFLQGSVATWCYTTKHHGTFIPVFTTSVLYVGKVLDGEGGLARKFYESMDMELKSPAIHKSVLFYMYTCTSMSLHTCI